MGIKPAPLWSPQDIVMRQALAHKAKINIANAKLTAMAAYAVLPSDKSWLNSVNKVLGDFSKLSFGIEGEDDKRDEQLYEEFNRIMKTTPVIERDKDGTLKVSGL